MGAYANIDYGNFLFVARVLYPLGDPTRELQGGVVD
jgi:hypothetical protein